MALSTTEQTAAAANATERGRSAPGWIFALFLAGLAFVYFGEQVLSGLERGAGFFTLLGLILTAVATALRFSPRFRAGGERKSIELLLAGLSLVGLLGLLVYFSTTELFMTKLGIDRMTTNQRVRFEELARVIWVSLIAISVIPMVFAETALRPMRNALRPESRRVRSAAIAGLSLAVAGVYGSFFVYSASGIGLKVDYSYFKTSRPSESSKKLVSSLTGDPIRAVAFFPDVNEVRPEVEGYLRELAASSPKLKVEVVDRLLVPKLAKDLRATQDGMIALTRGSMTQTLSIGTELEQARPKLKTLDRDLQEQLLKIARSKRTAYLTVGHGEINDAPRGKKDDAGRSAQIARTLLQKQNYTIKDLGLAQGLANDVPEDADVVLVLGPTVAFSREELSSLERYAARGGRLVLALDPDAIANPEHAVANAAELVTKEQAAKANAPDAVPAAAENAPDSVPVAEVTAEASFNQDLARIAGVKYQPEILANERQHVRVRYNDSDRTRLISNSFSSHASVSTLSRNSPRAAVVLFGSASLDQLEPSGFKLDFTVRSMTGTFQDANRNYSHDAASEKSQVFNLAAAVTKPLGEARAKPEPKKDDTGKKGEKPDAKADEPKEFRSFVLADADAFSDFVMGEVMGNQVLFVDAVRWLVGEESVQGLPNTEEDVRIEHTKQADLGWFYALIFGAPGLVLGAGFFVSRRSRTRGGKA